MKKIFLAVTCMATAFFQNTFAQDANSSVLLTSYYSIKDALVSGNAAAASSNAEAFVKTASGMDEKTLPPENKNTLVNEATQLSASKDIKQQRELFASFSSDMAAFVKTTRLPGHPVYQQYCPMKKASWLSSSKAIKNPYFGNAMLTCGKVVEAINE